FLRSTSIRFHLYFFFQAEVGIRDFHVTGVQTLLFRSTPQIPHKRRTSPRPPHERPRSDPRRVPCLRRGQAGSLRRTRGHWGEQTPAPKLPSRSSTRQS